jgi:hypothetical protein
MLAFHTALASSFNQCSESYFLSISVWPLFFAQEINIPEKIWLSFRGQALETTSCFVGFVVIITAFQYMAFHKRCEAMHGGSRDPTFLIQARIDYPKNPKNRNISWGTMSLDGRTINPPPTPNPLPTPTRLELATPLFITARSVGNRGSASPEVTGAPWKILRTIGPIPAHMTRIHRKIVFRSES